MFPRSPSATFASPPLAANGGWGLLFVLVSPLLATTILALLILILGYAWWYRAGQPVGFAATRDEVVEDMHAIRHRLAAGWRWITGRRGRGNA